MSAAGCTEVIGDQPTGYQPFYLKFSQKRILFKFIYTGDHGARRENMQFFLTLKLSTVSSEVHHFLTSYPPLFVKSGRFIPLVILMFRKKDGGISVVAKKRSAIGTFF
jgi:hypothetical protein